MAKIELAIEGMHCAACVRRVTQALTTVGGVKVESVEVGSARAEFNPAETTPEQITAAVDKIGFKASVAR